MTPPDVPPAYGAPAGGAAGDQPCNEFVEIVTDYLEDALPRDERARVDAHLEFCDGCTTVLAQWREVIRLTGRIADDQVDEVEPSTREHLMSSFRRTHDT